MLLAISASAATVDWAAGSWDNGSGFNAGYDAGAFNGTTNLGGGLQAAVTYSKVGTTVDLPGSGNMTASTTLNGSLVTPFSMQIQQQTDSNVGSTLSNYAALTYNFSSPVTLASAFTVYDVDFLSSAFVDFVTVEARNGGSGGTLQTVTYTPGAGFNILSTQYGLAGVLGTANAANSTNDGNALVSIAGSFDYIRLIFTQGQGSTTATHGIGISNMSITAAAPVPEPSALALAGLGIAFAAGRRVRRKS